ncbi:MAG: MBL fold metallo-hydrolase [Chloroflexi bacterium]|uniref:MBL fold metallo-hydrolase n=1 Tax=Candidatus Flexifilum breve TaxID=3140694 RepID=UPI00313528E3|nr:MBL fold metallo-hydrolase [Chloroflexota bacterium]MBK9751153.1 MBL fold metallo-hydrolase [Chloroflexota bacterium]
MSIEIKYVTLGLAQTNAYLVADTETNDAILIDPVDQAELLLKLATDAGWTIKLILATHAHFDHVLASAALKELTGAPFYIHSEAVPMLKNLPQTGLRFVGQLYPEAAEPDRLLTTESETITLGAIQLETLYTPGHAPGHLAFYMRDQDIVFSGDALFAGSVGRTDLPGSSWAVLERSIFDKLLTLPDQTRVLSGHGAMTTIGRERQTNPFLI